MSAGPTLSCFTFNVAVGCNLLNGNATIGSGFAIADGLILTARHSLFPENIKTEEPEHANGPVKIRWWHSRDKDFSSTSGRNSNGFIEACETGGNRGVVWECKSLDAAIVECRTPQDLGVRRFRFGSPAPKEFEFEACPHAANVEKDHRPVRVTGRCHDPSGQDNFFQLTQTLNSARSISHWRGASGAAIFVEDEIVGIVSRAREAGDVILQGVTSKAILEKIKIENGKLFNRIFPENDLLPKVERLVCLFLECDCSRLLIEKIAANIPSPNGSKTSTFIARKLTSLSAEEISELICSILENSSAREQQDLLSDAERLANLLFISKIYRNDSQAVRDAREISNNNFHQVSVGSFTSVEVIAASSEGRPIRFKKDGHVGPMPIGHACCASPPEGGNNQDPVSDLIDDMSAVDASQVGGIIDQALSSYWGEYKVPATGQLDVVDRHNSAVETLRRKSKRKNFVRPYLPILSKSSDLDNIKSWRNSASKYSQMDFYTLDLSDQASDLKELRPLLEVLDVIKGDV